MTVAPAVHGTLELCLRRAAHSYAAQGLQVFALLPRRKTPATRNGCRNASVDPLAIDAMWTKNASYNVAIATGLASGIVVLDVDEPEGESSLAALIQKHGPLPVTPQVLTVRGSHYYFAHPSSHVRNSAGKFGPGLDVRGDGGYVVAPPSIHPTGARYQWAPGRGIDDVVLAEMPVWLCCGGVESIAAGNRAATILSYPAEGYAQAALDRECHAVAKALPGRRNHQLNASAFAVGRLVGGGALAEPAVREALICAAVSCGLPEREAERTIDSGLAAGRKLPRTAPERPMAHTWGAAHDTADDRRELEAQPTPEWPEPTELPGLPAVPAWNDALLPDVLRPWLSDVSERTQCPPEYLAVGAIVTLASVIGRGCAIRPKQHDDWSVTPNLWGAIVGPPSAMKSPALRETMRPLLSLSSEESERHGQLAGEREELEAQLAAAKKALRTAAEKGHDTSLLVERYQTVSKLMAAAQRERRYIVYDATVEKIGEILNANPRGVLHYRDELAGWLCSLDRQGHESDRAFYLEAWSGCGEFIYDRIGRGTTRIESACVSLLGGIQPGPLGRYLREAISGGAGADGLMQRFQLLVYPDRQREWRNVDRAPNTAARDRVVELYRRMAQLAPSDIDADASDGIPFLRFDREAQTFFDSWHCQLMQRARSGVDHEAIEGHVVKYSSLMPALALIFHLAEGFRGPVNVTAVQRSAAWCELLEAHARRVYASVAVEKNDAARLLLLKIENGKLARQFTAREVYRAQWSGLAERETVEEAICVLEEHGWVRCVRVPTGGKDRVDVHVHPLLTRKDAGE